MKKTSKLFGAAALTAALAMGTAIPAFAAPAGAAGTGIASVEQGGHHAYTGQAASGDTTVNMKTENTQIDVAIPLSLSFYAKSSGGALTAPTAGLSADEGKTNDVGAYHIDNYSSAPVYITKADIAYADDNEGGKNWKLSEEAKENATTKLPPNASSTPAYGDVSFTATYWKVKNPSTEKTADTLKTFKITGVGKFDEVGTSDNALYIAAATDSTTPSKFGIDFAGYSSVLKKTDDTASEAIKITYTVSTSSAIGTADAGGTLDQTAN